MTTRQKILAFLVVLSFLLGTSSLVLSVDAFSRLHRAPQKFGASGFFANPIGPAVVNGLDAGTYPAPVLPTCDAGFAWTNGGPGSAGGCSAFAAEAGGGITALTGPVTASGSGSVASTITAGTAGCVFSTDNAGSPAVTCAPSAGDVTTSGSVTGSVLNYVVTSLQGADVTVSTGGAVQCIAGLTSCGFTQANTSGASPSAFSITASGSTAATGTGANLNLSAGTATGGTSGTPGSIVLSRGAPSGSGSEATVQIGRGNTVDYLFRSLTSSNLGVSTWFGSTNAGTPTTSNYSFYVPHAGGNLQINDATEILLTLGGSIYETITTTTTTLGNSNIVLGNSGSGGTLTFNGPAVTTTQLVAQTGATLSAGQHYFFLPIHVNGSVYSMVMSQ